MFKWKDNLGNWIQLAELDSTGKVPKEQLPSQLPDVTSADNNKFLCVVNGIWDKKAVPNAENSTF